MATNNKRIIEVGIEVLRMEAESVLKLTSRLNSDFCEVVNRVLTCRGKIVVTGIGKSGHIARKMASTLSSTGTPALFLHPAESRHGDLGVIADQDLVIAISYGGEASELNAIIHFALRRGVTLVALTGTPESTLGKAAQYTLNIQVDKEAGPLSLAPTSSSTAALAMGDAIAMAVLDQRGFNTENFAEFHPAGSLGARLQRVKDIMKTGEALPFLTLETPMKEVLTTMTHQSVRGAAGVTDESDNLVGIITDGDIRRFLEKHDRPFEARAKDIMSHHPKTIDADEYVEKALHAMEKNKIQVLIVLDQSAPAPRRPVGMVVYQDLFISK